MLPLWHLQYVIKNIADAFCLSICNTLNTQMKYYECKNCVYVNDNTTCTLPDAYNVIGEYRPDQRSIP